MPGKQPVGALRWYRRPGVAEQRSGVVDRGAAECGPGVSPVAPTVSGDARLREARGQDPLGRRLVHGP